jgi:hypothetical protein
MISPRSEPPLTAAATILLVLATALPVLLLHTPPFVDVLGHMGRYELQTSLPTEPWLQRFYSFDWQLIGNLGADLLVEVTQPLLGVVGATKLAIVLVPLTASTAILMISRQVHGRVTAFAVASLALVYALPFNWGFLNFSLAMALALLAFSSWLRLGDRPRRAALFVPLSLCLWLCHTFGWAFLGILCTADSLAHAWTARLPLRRIVLDTLRRGWPLLAPLAPMLLWRNAATAAGIDGWFDWSQKASWLISIQRLAGEEMDKLCAAGLLLAVIAGIALPRIKMNRRIGLAAAIAFAAFLLLPKQVFGSVFADMRLAPYVVMLGLLALDDGKLQRTTRVSLMLLALAFLVTRLTLTGIVYQDREHALDGQLGALSVIPERARIATLIEIPCQSEWALPWFSHIGSMAIVRKHAFANDQWANASMNPLQVHFAAAGSYATDDRQLYFPARCGMAPELAQTLKALPLRAFTHIWVVGARPSTIPVRKGLTLRWRSGNAAVFTVDRPLPLQPQRIRKLSKLQP